MKNKAQTRKKSIFTREDIDYGFQPLYDKLYSGHNQARLSPENFTRALTAELTDAGLQLSALLLNNMSELFIARVDARSLHANAGVTLKNKNDKSEFISMGEGAVSFGTGLPILPVLSSTAKKISSYIFDINMQKMRMAQRNDSNFKIRAIVAAYVLVLLIAEDLEKCLPEYAKHAKRLSSNEDFTIENLPAEFVITVQKIAVDMMHVIEKDLVERNSVIQWKDMVVTAIMGIPASRLDGTGEQHKQNRRDHISSRYIRQYSPRQREFVEQFNEHILKRMGLSPWSTDKSLAGEVTEQRRARWRELEANHTSLMHELAAVNINNTSIDTQVLHDDESDATGLYLFKEATKVLETAHRAQLQHKPQQKFAAPQPISAEVKSIDSIIDSLNIDYAKRQLLDKVTADATGILRITNISRLTEPVKDEIEKTLRENRSYFDSLDKIEFVFADCFNFDEFDTASVREFESKVKKHHAGLKVTYIAAEDNAKVLPKLQETVQRAEISTQSTGVTVETGSGSGGSVGSSSQLETEYIATRAKLKPVIKRDTIEKIESAEIRSFKRSGSFFAKTKAMGELVSAPGSRISQVTQADMERLQQTMLMPIVVAVADDVMTEDECAIGVVPGVNRKKPISRHKRR